MSIFIDSIIVYMHRSKIQTHYKYMYMLYTSYPASPPASSWSSPVSSMEPWGPAGGGRTTVTTCHHGHVVHVVPG